MTFLVATSPVAPGLDEIVPGFCWASARPVALRDCGSSVVFFDGDLGNLTQLRQHFGRPDATAEELVALLLAEDGSLERALGEYVVVAVDPERRLIRGFTDRSCVGELNYVQRGELLVLSPDLKLILPYSDGDLDQDAVARFFSFGSLDRRETLLAQVRRIKHFYTLQFDGTLEIRDDYLAHLARIGPDRSQAETEVLDGMAERLGEVIGELSSLGRPLFNTLSGGVDSSQLQVLLAAKGYRKSFSVTYEGVGGDNQYASDVADALGTEHLALTFNHRQLLEFVRQGVRITGEPFVNQGEAMFQHVYGTMRQEAADVVATSGQTADATVGAGVPRSLQLAARLRLLPASLVRLMARGVTLSNEVVSALRQGDLNSDLLVMATETDPQRLRRALRCLDYEGDVFQPSSELSRSFAWSPIEILSRVHLFQSDWMTFPSTVRSLAAAHGVTLKFPFTDPRFVEFMLSVPVQLKSRRYQSKYLGKKLLARSLPKSCVYRQKLPMHVPFAAMFGEPLGQELLEELRSAAYYRFDVDELLAEEQYWLLMRLANFHFWTVDLLSNAGATRVRRG